MGDSGHILGKRKLAKLSRDTGHNFALAFIRNHWCEGVEFDESGQCHHYVVDKTDWSTTEDTAPNRIHWTICGSGGSASDLR